MAFIDWTAKFSVGSPTIDQQHKRLIAIINKLHDAMLKGGVKNDMEMIFKDLIAYTESHFSAEEAMLKKINYPRLASHQQQHLEFVQTARNLHAQLLAGKFTVSMDLLRYLKTWLSEHILGTDQQYAPFLADQRSPISSRA